MVFLPAPLQHPASNPTKVFGVKCEVYCGLCINHVDICLPCLCFCEVQ